ncbi:MAG: tRNA pseudouridine(38-40) synthase TruA [Candidatus Omnitrophica bacterium]|nr:tRNA pseudouridine(38-40) synthase TruA [Candidatus Omnitrophota bacterium]
MRTIKLTIAYDGTDYCGWQRQENGLSVQEVLEKKLRKILGEKITVTGSGRTDSGVHARAQIAHFKTTKEMPLRNIYRALIAHMPADIAVIRVAQAGAGFDAQRDARQKKYRYTIYNDQVMSPFLRRYALHIPYRLDVNKMNAAARYLAGRHDFASFQNAHSSAKTSVRTIQKITVRKKGAAITVDVAADGFLYNMVRSIAGTLIEVGRGKIAPDDVLDILNKKDRACAGPTVPPHGLALMRVYY